MTHPLNSSNPVAYNDRKVRIIVSMIAAFLVSSYGGNQTIFKLLLTIGFYIEFLVSFIFTILIVETIAFVTRRLDRNYDWNIKPLPRALLQVLFGILLPSIIEFLLAALYFALSGYNILKTTFVDYAFPLIVMMIILFNAYYFIFYIIVKWKDVKEYAVQNEDGSVVVSQFAEGESKETILVNKGIKTFPVPISQVAYFFRNQEDESNYLRTFEREDFFLNLSLEDIQMLLDEKNFFRVNRQMIVNYAACKHYELMEYGKLRLEVMPDFDRPIVISQIKAKIYKDWYDR
ncbi:LytTR family DNA-binding domain-containing protein [Pedobacter panaciterrae]|uniref:LytTR family transcriptional regulator DNA-binding domain-containing protein n=1 Tax=Pedobacter panaciterrae TaxID=363849 RepID=UPI0025940D32|nr:LytTR family DNA-binding domain-containing protein [uncultured Pedobacter sp.]